VAESETFTLAAASFGYLIKTSDQLINLMTLSGIPGKDFFDRITGFTGLVLTSCKSELLLDVNEQCGVLHVYGSRI
jgi:hypothetical protein